MAWRGIHSPTSMEAKPSKPASKELRGPSKAHAASVLWLICWFALLAGLGEIALQAFLKYYLHRSIFLSRDLVWMAPLANLFLFALPGFPILLAAWRWPHRITLRVTATVFAFLSFLSLLFMIGPLHKLAAVLLSAGLAVQMARFIARHHSGFNHLITRSLWAMLLVILSLTALVSGSEFLRERRALSQLPAPPAGAPNVLFITLDTVRARSLSLYGYGRKTSPQLERLAARGVVFERAFATAPWTLPSHASMFTGRFPHELRADWNVPLDDQHPTLAEAFSAQGYLTAGFAANTLYCSYEHGLDRGFAHYEDYTRSPGQIFLSSSLGRFFRNGLLPSYIEKVKNIGLKTAAESNRDFLDWMSTADDRRPFFVFLNYFDAHEPYMSPAPFETRFGPKRVRPDARKEREWTQAEAQVVIDAYDGSIAYIDHQLGLLVDELERRGLMENTLVIVTSDHGEQFGENGLYDHANSLYRPLLEVPLVISFPARVPAEKRIKEPVTLADLPSTVVKLAALQHAPRFPGNSLTRHWESGTALGAKSPLLMQVSKGINQPDWLPVSKGDMKSLVADGMHYIRNGDGREELYDFDNDVLDERDLAGTAEGQRALERLRKYLDVSLNTNQTLTLEQGPR